MKQFIIITSALLLSFLTGCSTERITDYQPTSTSVRERTAQVLGVEVAVDPFVESERTEKYFDINAVAEGIGIVFVRVSNNTSNQTFIVEKKNFQLVLAGSSSDENADTQTIERSTSGGQAVAITGAVVGSFGGMAIMFIGGSMISHSMEIQRNFVGKEMPDQTLAPGESMKGFIYYSPVPKNAAWPRGAKMKINLTETKSHESVSTTIPLSQ